MFIFATILVCAFLLDLIFGDPVYKLHPVRLTGNLITSLEKIIYPLKINRKISGSLLTIISIIIIILLFNLICLFLITLNFNFIFYLFSTYIIYSCISLKDLLLHSQKVVSELNVSLEKGQNSVQMIVGRNAKLLNKDGVIKATVECIAESFVDGILSPIFCFFIGIEIAIFVNLNPVLLAASLVLIQRITNTIDSMIGYKNEKYADFGCFGAKFDDVINFIPARLSIVFIFIGAFILRLNYILCLKIFLRDRLNHTSPNSAHPEAAVAGALGIQLGGPTIYSHGNVNKPYLGEKINNISIVNILIAGKLIITASSAAILTFAVIILA